MNSQITPTYSSITGIPNPGHAPIWLTVLLALGMVSSSHAVGVIAGWDTHALPGGINAFGVSPYPASSTDANLTVNGLVRGIGVGTTGNAALRGWGGNGWIGSNVNAAITAGEAVTFTITPNVGYQASFTAISRLSYRRSSSGPANGVLQYQLGSGAFSNIANLVYTSTSSSGSSIAAIDLSGIAALQNIPAGTPVTFRIANFGATSTNGSWYIYDTLNTSAADLEITGMVTAYNPVINGACGAANGQVFAASPVNNLCSAGTPSAVTGSGPWNWTCSGSNGGGNANCSATSSDTGICP